MEKPISLRIQELKEILVQKINESKLPIEVIAPITNDIATQVSQLAMQRAEQEKAEYEKSLLEEENQETEIEEEN